MDISSGEESEFSDSEITEYKDKPYEQLRNGTLKVKYPGGIYRCPFCAGKKKQNFKYKDLHQHASGVSKGSSNRSAKQKANHLALTLYLENELADEAEKPLKVAAPITEENKLFCWPWTGILVNIVKESDGANGFENTEYWLKRFSKYKPEEVEGMLKREPQKRLISVWFKKHAKVEEMGDLEDMIQTLVVKERESNDELQEARKELIKVFKGMKGMFSGHTNIGVKRMGEIDSKPFLDACKVKYGSEEAQIKASELCSMWQEELKNPAWHPVDVVAIDGAHEDVINENDKKLKALKAEWGSGIFDAVVAAFMELNEYNPSGY
ncbi:putative XS domain-containing protein [Helianthus annuus]|nr:putative XS domain-containing protein [Helianthus annuus]